MKRIFKCLFLCMLFISVISKNMEVYAADLPGFQKGTYEVEVNLSCFVNAMGGVEFGAPLLERAEVTIGEDDKGVISLYFVKSSVTIYNVTCDIYIDPNETLGYYDKDGNLQTELLEITMSSEEDLALNPNGESVSYLTSVSFPLDQITDTYQLALYINSNVMGTQFGVGDYSATLTVDWSTVPEAVEGEVVSETVVEEVDEKTNEEVENFNYGLIAGISGTVSVIGIAVVFVKKRKGK